MRLLETHPVAEGRSRRAPIEEVLEVFRVIDLRDAGRRRLGARGVHDRSRRVAGALRDPLKIARAPALARRADGVAGFFQQVRINFEARRKISAVRHCFLELPGVAAREDARAARAAFRIRRERVSKQHAFACDAVKIRRLHPRGAIRAGVLPAPVVEDDE